MATRKFFISKDQDTELKFWDERPCYNDCEDDFHGKFAGLSPKTYRKAREYADSHLKRGTFEPFFVTDNHPDHYSNISYAKKIKSKKTISQREALDLLSKGFRNVIAVIGKETKRYESLPGVDLTDFKSRIIRIYDDSVRADEMITDIFGCPEEEDEHCEYYLNFIVRTENVYEDYEEWQSIQEIVENNAHSYFALLNMLEMLETNIFIEDCLDSDDHDEAALAMKSINCTLLYSTCEYGKECFKKAFDSVKDKLGIELRKDNPIILNHYCYWGGYYYGVVFGNTADKKDITCVIIGRKDLSEEGRNSDTIYFWIAVDPETGKPKDFVFDDEIELREHAVKSTYKAITEGSGQDTISGYDFFSEMIARDEKYNEETYKEGYCSTGCDCYDDDFDDDDFDD